MFLRQSLVSQPDYMVLSGEFIFDLEVGGFLESSVQLWICI